MVCNIYEKIYNSKLDPSLIKLHICEKTSVEYNNQINQSESISGLLGGISTIIQNALQTLDVATPLLDPKAFLNYIQSLIRDIDPNTKSIITDETIQLQLQIIQGKLNQMCEQLGIDPSQLQTNQ